MMNQKNRYRISLLMVLSFCVTAISGLVILFLPHGSFAGHIKFIGIFKYQWKFVHVWGGFLLLAFVIIHFIDHWNWMMQKTKKIFKKNKY